MDFLELGYLAHPAISNCFSLLAYIAQSTPAISWTFTVRRNTGLYQSGGTVNAPPDKAYWKLRIVLTCCGNESKVQTDSGEWVDFQPLRMQKVKFRDQKEIWRLAISHPRYLELFLDTLESFR